MKNAIKRQDVFELLVQADMEMVGLALQLDHRFDRLRNKYPCDDDTDGWDPDAHFTPIEVKLHRLAELFGYNYDDILAESNRRMKAGPTYAFMKDEPTFCEKVKEWFESEDGQKFERSWGSMANAYKQAMYKAM